MNDFEWNLGDDYCYIYHHGILGQKWGVRRYQNYDGTLTSAGLQRLNKNQKAKLKSEHYGAKVNGLADDTSINLRHNTVDALIAGLGMTAVGGLSTAALASTTGYLYLHPLGLALTGGVLVTASGISLIKGDINNIRSKSKEKQFAEERSKSPLDKASGLHKKTHEMTREEDRERVNPGYKNWDENTKNNCAFCTMTYELRRRGYDVTAKKSIVGLSDKDFNKVFPKAKTEKVKGSITPEAYRMKLYQVTKEESNTLKDNVESTLLKQGNGARGNLGIAWAGTMSSGHSIAYEVQDGKVHYYDSQSNKEYKTLKDIPDIWDANVIRLDNVKENKKELKEVCE